MSTDQDRPDSPPVVAKREDGAYTAGPPDDGRPVAEHLDELGAPAPRAGYTTKRLTSDDAAEIAELLRVSIDDKHLVAWHQRLHQIRDKMIERLGDLIALCENDASAGAGSRINGPAGPTIEIRHASASAVKIEGDASAAASLVMAACDFNYARKALNDVEDCEDCTAEDDLYCAEHAWLRRELQDARTTLFSAAHTLGLPAKPRRRRIPVTPKLRERLTNGDYVRAGGNAKCERCERTYNEHDVLDTPNGGWWAVACGGRIFKL